VQIAHLKLFALKKQKFSVVAKLVTHSWQPRKKGTNLFSYAITQFFNATNPYKKMMNTNNKFWKIWFSILTKAYKPLSNCENIWL
jgi:hypothetical protein